MARLQNPYPFDAPARQSLAVEMVEDRGDLMNAIALNSTMFNLGRVVGPAVGGVILAALGPAWCFGLNGVSFLAVIGALLGMRLLPHPAPTSREPLTQQVAAGLQYIRTNGPVRLIILLLGVSTIFGFSYSTLMPAYDVLQVGETGLGLLTTSVGVGALAGSLIEEETSRFSGPRGLSRTAPFRPSGVERWSTAPDGPPVRRTESCLSGGRG